MLFVYVFLNDLYLLNMYGVSKYIFYVGIFTIYWVFLIAVITVLEQLQQHDYNGLNLRHNFDLNSIPNCYRTF